MPARLTRRQSDLTRERIKVTRCIQALQDHLDGKRELSQSQIMAAQTLLRYGLAPPPQETQHTGELTIRWKS